MAVRLFVGNLSYSTTEADLRTYFGAVAPPSQVVLPVDRETGRPRGFAFVEYHRPRTRRAGDSAVQRSGVQRPAARGQRGARARGSRTRRSRRARRASSGPPGRRRLRPASAASFGGPPRPFDPSAPPAPRAAGTSGPTPSRSAAAAPRQRRRNRAAARADPAQEHRPLLHARRRLAGRGRAGHRRLRDEQAARARGQGARGRA